MSDGSNDHSGSLSDLKISGCQENWYAQCRQLGISLQGNQEGLVIIVINTYRISARQHRRGWLPPGSRGTRGRSPGSWGTPSLPGPERGTQDSCPAASAQADGHQWGKGESGLSWSLVPDFSHALKILRLLSATRAVRGEVWETPRDIASPWVISEVVWLVTSPAGTKTSNKVLPDSWHVSLFMWTYYLKVWSSHKNYCDY